MESLNKFLFMRGDSYTCNSNQCKNRSELLTDRIEEYCIILQVPDALHGKVEAYKKIIQNSKSIEEYLLEMQSSNFDRKTALLEKEARLTFFKKEIALQ